MREKRVPDGKTDMMLSLYLLLQRGSLPCETTFSTKISDLPQLFCSLSKWQRANIFSVSFSADNRQIVSASRDRTIKLWNTLGECKFNIVDDGHSEWVSCVRFSPNPVIPVIVSAGWDKVVKVSLLVLLCCGCFDMMLSFYICYFRGVTPYETIFPPRSLISSLFPSTLERR